MTDLLQIIEELEYVKNIEFPEKLKFGLNIKLSIRYDRIFDFSEILLSKGFQLNLIKAFRNSQFKIFYIFSSINQNFKLLAEVIFEEDNIPSISDLYFNAGFFEKDINDIYGSVFTEDENLIEEKDMFLLGDESFDSVNKSLFYFKVLTCGEFAKRIITEKGYNERFLESYGDSFSWRKFLVKSSRIDYYSGFFSNLCLCELLEMALDIELPMRASQIRNILSELIRIKYNLNHISDLLNYIGLYALSSSVEMMKENVNDITDLVQGRPVSEFNFVGGVFKDIEDDFQNTFQNKTSDMLKVLEDLKKNYFIKTRLEGIFKIESLNAVKSGFSGVYLRSCGIDYDVRTLEKKNSNVRNRWLLLEDDSIDESVRFDYRIDEIIKSYGIIIKTLNRLETGPVHADIIKSEMIPAGEYFNSVESPRGRLSYFLKANGSEIPSLIGIETPSISLFNYLNKIEDVHLDDVPLLIHSLGFSMAEVDR